VCVEVEAGLESRASPGSHVLSCGAALTVGHICLTPLRMQTCIGRCVLWAVRLCVSSVRVRAGACNVVRVGWCGTVGALHGTAPAPPYTLLACPFLHAYTY
jgi:hypothetical protein